MTAHWILPAALSFLGFGVGNAILKHSTHTGDPAPAAIVGIHLAAWAAALVWALGAGLPFRPDAFKLGLVTGLIGFTGLVTFYAALQRGLAVKVFPIMRLNTLITVGLAVAVLAERPSVVVAGGIVVAVAAMWILSGSDRDAEDGSDLTWFWLALVTLVTFGTVNFLVDLSASTAAGRASPVVGLYAPTSVLAIGYQLWAGDRTPAPALGRGAGVGVLYVVGFFGLTTGYGAGTVSRVAPFMGLNILIPMAASVALMGERITWRVATGTPLALFAMYLLSVG